MAKSTRGMPQGAVDYARRLANGSWIYTKGPSKGRFAPVRDGKPLLPGFKLDSLRRVYSVQERRARAARTIGRATPRGEVPPSRQSYARRFGLSRLQGIPTVYMETAAQDRLAQLGASAGVDYLGELVTWAADKFAAGAATSVRNHFITVAGKASHWSSYAAQWDEGQWGIIGASIKQPDVVKGMASAEHLRVSYDKGGLATNPKGPPPLPRPIVSLLVPLREVAAKRWGAAVSKARRNQ